VIVSFTIVSSISFVSFTRFICKVSFTSHVSPVTYLTVKKKQRFQTTPSVVYECHEKRCTIVRVFVVRFRSSFSSVLRYIQTDVGRKMVVVYVELRSPLITLAFIVLRVYINGCWKKDSRYRLYVELRSPSFTLSTRVHRSPCIYKRIQEERWFYTSSFALRRSVYI
jgi:hypothetical protein